MEIFKEGDKSKAICHCCKKRVETTFQVRTATIRDGNASYRVPDVLVGVCDECDETLSVPQQSFAAVAEIRKKAEKETMDVRLPRHLLDVLNNSISTLGIEVSSDLRGQLLRLALASIRANKIDNRRLRTNLTSELLKGSFRRGNRLTLKLNSQLESHVEELREFFGFNKTELIDSVIVDLKSDILDQKDPARFDEIRRALLATG